MGRFQHECDWDEDDEPRAWPFVASLFTPEGKLLASEVSGHVLRIDGIPVRYEGVFVIPRRWSAWADQAWNDPITLVTDDGLRLGIKISRTVLSGQETEMTFVTIASSA